MTPEPCVFDIDAGRPCLPTVTSISIAQAGSPVHSKLGSQPFQRAVSLLHPDFQYGLAVSGVQVTRLYQAGMLQMNTLIAAVQERYHSDACLLHNHHHHLQRHDAWNSKDSLCCQPRRIICAQTRLQAIRPPWPPLCSWSHRTNGHIAIVVYSSSGLTLGSVLYGADLPPSPVLHTIITLRKFHSMEGRSGQNWHSALIGGVPGLLPCSPYCYIMIYESAAVHEASTLAHVATAMCLCGEVGSM